MIKYKYEEEKITALYLAELLGDFKAKSIIEKGSVSSIEEAIHLSKFYWKMVDNTIEDNITLPCEGSVEYWLEKLMFSLGGYLERAGYEKEWDEVGDAA